ncbi:hypothetical protein, partial [Endozoicomonas sp. YOMI1]|uniref:hypothetical protein n=1 Tax=Endozoicomonas sp. YOMI1 TaxID=2828739 RepID=UPI00214913B9
MNTVHPPSTTISQTNLSSLYPQPPLDEHKKIPVKQLSHTDLLVNIAHSTANSPEQCTRADDGTLRKVAVLTHPGNPPYSLSPLMIRSENSNHLVKREDWIPYGDPDVFNTEFRLFVDRFKNRIIQKDITAKDLIAEAINTRKNIEVTRNYICADEFGLLRNNPKAISKYRKLCLHTRLNTTYSCGKQRAVALTHNEFFINHRTKEGEKFVNLISSKYQLYPCEIDNIHYGVVVGNAKDNKVYLTQILTSPRIKVFGMEYIFGRYDEHYVGEDRRSALIIHTDPDQLIPGLQHVQGLIDQAMAGDLSVIPRIHWWYVHL